MKARIAIVGDFDPRNPTHLATNEAIQHAARSLNESVESEWLATEASEHADFNAYHGFWIAPGSPYKSHFGALRAIRYAREEKVPLFGTCAAFSISFSSSLVMSWGSPMRRMQRVIPLLRGSSFPSWPVHSSDVVLRLN